MAQNSLDHRRHLRGRATFELGVNAHRLPFHVPVDHDARPPVSNMPLGQQVLVPGSKFLGVRGAGSRALAPDLCFTDLENRIGDMGNGVPQLLFMNVATAHIAQIGVGGPWIGAGQAFEAGIGAQAIQAQQ